MAGESLILLPMAYQPGALLGHRPSAFDANKVIPIEVKQTRNSVALRRNKAGLWVQEQINVPRLHWDVGGVNPAWLFETSATNQLTQNTSFSGWTIVLQSLSDGAQSPISGVLSKRMLVTSAGSNYLLKSLTATGTRTVTASLMLKNVDYVGNEVVSINCSDGIVGGMTAYYKPSNDTVTFANAASWTNVSVKKTAEGQGFTRVEITGTVTSASGGWLEITGVNGRSIDITAAQVETGNVATSPIITAGSPVTRVVDLIPDIPLNIGNTFTIFIHLKSHTTYAGSASFMGFGATGAKGNFYFIDGNNLMYYSVGSGYLGLVGSTVNGVKMAVVSNGVGANNIKVHQNGNLVATGSNPDSSLDFLTQGFSSIAMAIQQIKIYPTAFDSIAANALTT